MITVKDLREKDVRDIHVNLSYTVLALGKVARWALENDTSGIDEEDRKSSVATVLEVMETLAEQIVEAGEFLERETRLDAAEKAERAA